MLPSSVDTQAFRTVMRDEAVLRPAVDEIARRHGLPGDVLRYAAGSLPVYAVGDVVLKLFPPHEAAHADTEWTSLVAVDGRLPIPTPSPIARGEIDGWPYVVMGRLRGRALSEAWASLDRADRERLCATVGEALRALHALPADALPPLLVGDWEAFLRAQAAGCVDRQRSLGLGEPWLARIPAFLERELPGLLATSERALLHTEVMREHLLVGGVEGVGVDVDGAVGPVGPVLTGLVDFEPAMVGAPEYDLASVGVFVTSGDAGLLRALLLAAGRDPDDKGLPRRILAYALLHRYSNLRWYLERLPAPDVDGLDELAVRWFGASAALV